MSSMKTLAVLLGAVALAATIAPDAARAQHDHDPQAHVTAPVPPPVQHWAADADLRDGMGRIHAALDELRHYEMGHMDATMALDRASLIEQAAADIFAKCKLAPEQDAVMHGMLVPLLAAVQRFKANPQDTAQVAAVRKAVADYPRYFDDPGWAVAATHTH
jgi:hypothetical protein